MKIDSGYLLRVPTSSSLPEEEEDEFSCTNLDICIPSIDIDVTKAPGLPVLVWIHGMNVNDCSKTTRSFGLLTDLVGSVGGSQAVSFGTAKSGICSKSVTASSQSSR